MFKSNAMLKVFVMQFNERKLEILTIVRQQKVVDSESLSYILDIPYRHASMQLLRYNRQGLLCRQKIDNGYFGYYSYTLSRKGYDKIIFLESYFD